MKKKVVILGSTGTIGLNTLKVIDHLSNEFEIVGLAAGRRYETLIKQAQQYNVNQIVISHDEDYQKAKKIIPMGTQLSVGVEGLIELVTRPEVDIVVCAIVGTAGLLPMLAAAKCGKRLAIASKEILVMAGDLMNETATQYGAEILPIDSEHSAILQCLAGRQMEEVSRLILTASGGPFRGQNSNFLSNVTPEMALRHPTWQMGKKITTDSATLMNKALEYIEAHYLFHLSCKQIDVVIHPQSIIHSMVEFIDGTLLAQMGEPDMCSPIQFALTYPQKTRGTLPRFDFSRYNHLTFEPLNQEVFPSLKFAHFALEKGGSYPAVLNAANEVAVERFHAGKIKFTDIFSTVEKVLNAHVESPLLTIENILEIDQQTRISAYAI